MGFIGAVERFSVACDICAALAAATTRIGDRFGLIAGGAHLREEVYLPPKRRRSVALEAVERLRRETPAGASVSGLTLAAQRLGAGRKLVLLISDFRWPQSDIDRVFDALALHDVMPVALVNSVEINPPRWGLLELRDCETGRRRMMVMRPSLQQRWIAAETRRRQRLTHLAASRARAPIFIEDDFDPHALSLRLMAG